jgi:type III secretion system FlhB-like substrate exporter
MATEEKKDPIQLYEAVANLLILAYKGYRDESDPDLKDRWSRKIMKLEELEIEASENAIKVIVEGAKELKEKIGKLNDEIMIAMENNKKDYETFVTFFNTLGSLFKTALDLAGIGKKAAVPTL